MIRSPVFFFFPAFFAAMRSSNAPVQICVRSRAKAGIHPHDVLYGMVEARSIDVLPPRAIEKRPLEALKRHFS
jgi:hypothetical protein